MQNAKEKCGDAKEGHGVPDIGVKGFGWARRAKDEFGGPEIGVKGFRWVWRA